MKELLPSQKDIFRGLSEVENAIPNIRQLITQKLPVKYHDFYNEKVDYELASIERTRELALKDDRPPEYVERLVSISETDLCRLEAELSSYQPRKEVA